MGPRGLSAPWGKTFNHYAQIMLIVTTFSPATRLVLTNLPLRSSISLRIKSNDFAPLMGRSTMFHSIPAPQSLTGVLKHQFLYWGVQAPSAAHRLPVPSGSLYSLRSYGNLRFPIASLRVNPGWLAARGHQPSLRSSGHPQPLQGRRASHQITLDGRASTSGLDR